MKQTSPSPGPAQQVSWVALGVVGGGRARGRRVLAESGLHSRPLRSVGTFHPGYPEDSPNWGECLETLRRRSPEAHEGAMRGDVQNIMRLGSGRQTCEAPRGSNHCGPARNGSEPVTGHSPGKDSGRRTRKQSPRPRSRSLHYARACVCVWWGGRQEGQGEDRGKLPDESAI